MDRCSPAAGKPFTGTSVIILHFIGLLWTVKLG
jgi:hypothetical protein